MATKLSYQGRVLRTIFMGTPDFAVPSLVALAEATDLVCVLTRPDAVRARGKKTEPSPVKAQALELGVPVLEGNRITPELLEELASYEADVV